MRRVIDYLRGTSDHVLDEIPVSGGVNDRDVVFGGFEFPQGNINGDTTLALGFQLVQNPGVLEGTFTHLKTDKCKYDKNLNN